MLFRRAAQPARKLSTNAIRTRRSRAKAWNLSSRRTGSASSTRGIVGHASPVKGTAQSTCSKRGSVGSKPSNVAYACPSHKIPKTQCLRRGGHLSTKQRNARATCRSMINVGITWLSHVKCSAPQTRAAALPYPTWRSQNHCPTVAPLAAVL